MAQLVVRSLDPRIVRRLRAVAARHGRSAEAEHREILRKALLDADDDRTLGDALLEMPAVGDDADFVRKADRPRRVKL